MQLSRHFSLEEMVHSQTATRLKLANVPSDESIDNLRGLCTLVLEPLRDSLGRPIKIDSGYRSPAVNAAVHGAANSDHLRGCAADILCPPLSVDELMRAVVRLAPGLPIKKVIYEFGQWVHISYDLEAGVLELLATTDGATYTPWAA